MGQGGGQVGVLGAGGGLPGGALLRVSPLWQQLCSCGCRQLAVELVVGLAGGGRRAGWPCRRLRRNYGSTGWTWTR